MPEARHPAKERILFVADSSPARHMAHRTLVKHGYDCITAADGAGARAVLAEHTFELAICDLPIPGESGLAFATFLRQAHPETAVLMVIADGELKMAMEALDSGAFGCLSKPIDGNRLLIHVACALHHRQRRLKTDLNLQRLEVELATRASEIEDLNGALRVLSKQRDEDRRIMEENILANVRNVVQPCLQRLENSGRLNRRQIDELSRLQLTLNTLVAPFAQQLSSEYFGLTPTEIQVATLIKQGKRTKEIVEILNLSPNTIMTHRHKIRTKLGLIGTHKTLYASLNSLFHQ